MKPRQIGKIILKSTLYLLAFAAPMMGLTDYVFMSANAAFLALAPPFTGAALPPPSQDPTKPAVASKRALTARY